MGYNRVTNGFHFQATIQAVQGLKHVEFDKTSSTVVVVSGGVAYGGRIGLQNLVISMLMSYLVLCYMSEENIFSVKVCNSLVAENIFFVKGCDTLVPSTISTSEASLIGKSPRLLFQYDRGGKYRSKKTSMKVTGTKKIDCPFRLKEVKMRTGDDCMARVTAEKAGKTQMQVVMSFLQHEGYIFESQTNVVTNELEDLFFAHPGSLERWRAFPHVLLMDSTYKTNRYKMPLLEIVGATATNMTFCIAFVFLHSEKVFNYTWALRCLQSTMDGCTGPRVIVTDKELALMNASAQSDLVTSLTFIHQVIQSQDIAIKASIDHNKTIVQHRFNIPHFQELRGFVSSHALHMILKEFEQSKNAEEVFYKCGCQLRTSYGLPCAHEQAIYLNDGRPIPMDSIDNFWRKLDLSSCVSLQDDDIDCDVDLQTNNRGRPSLKKKVTLNTRANPSALLFVESDSPHSGEPSRHSYSFGGPDSKSREDISTRANTTTFEFVEPYIFQFQEPARHSGSSIYNYSVHAYVRQFPPILHPYIMHVQDVKPDENYGFWAIAVCLGLHDDAWATIRYNLIEELHIFRTQYVAIFGSDDQWTRVYNSPNFFALDRGALIEHWMTMSDIGLLIASKFNVILHVLSVAQSLTYFPLRSTPPPSYQHVAISIEYVNNNHCVHVVLTKGYPMPPIMPHAYMQYMRSRFPSGTIVLED
ncbi:uncharacterized protein LOC119981899 [Tripterygium wilfordii]|uniref:uncharacterized protein LOC119981899 n=1 Tax=Tripterygium wilfordii TaxID=458696 RepID=UPI0018F7E9A2|nr:uncharacterized protein LOC119981899 [Tripterygium wilfordii]